MSFFEDCTPKQRQALAAAQKATGVRLKDANPANPEFQNTSGGQSVLTFLSANYPNELAEFRATAEGFSLSLESVMYDRDEIELTKEIHDWKMEHDSVYRKQHVANNDAEYNRLEKWLQEQGDADFEARTGTPASERDRPNFALHGQMAGAMEQQWIHRRLMSD